jgi:hypothetical protein
VTSWPDTHRATRLAGGRYDAQRRLRNCQYEVANQGISSPRFGHEPVSEQRLAIGGGSTPAPVRRPGRVPAWSAAATSCPVSASMTMFRRSRTRRTTCRRTAASRGPMVAEEGPVATGSVTPGPVEEMVLVRLLDMPDLQRLLRRLPDIAVPGLGPAMIMSRIVRFTTLRARPGGSPPPRPSASTPAWRP